MKKLKQHVQFLLMAITYPAGCDEEELVHFCDECEDPELARVRAIAFIKQSYVFTNPALASEWITGIESGDIIIIPATRGSFDGGTPKLVTGYGDVAEKYASSDYSLTYFDPNYKTNRDFYNALKRSVNYKVAYKTETLVHMTDKVASIAPKAPVVDDVTGYVEWEVNVKWSSKNEPTAHIAPVGIFSCFEVTE